MASYSFLLFFVGQWTSLSYGGRYLLPVALIVAVLLGLRARKRMTLRGGFPPSPDRIRRVLAWCLVAFLTFQCLQITLGMNPGEPTVDLPAPVRGTTIGVSEGGRHPLLNRFVRQNPSRTATEFLPLNGWGHVSDKEMTVVSPIDGRVVRALVAGATGAESHTGALKSNLAEVGTETLLIQGDSLVVLMNGIRGGVQHGSVVRPGDVLGTSGRLVVDVSQVAGDTAAPSASASASASASGSASASTPVHASSAPASSEPGPSSSSVFVRYEGAYLVKNSILSLR